MIGKVAVSDSRSVFALLSDLPPLLTPAGKRPLDPMSIRISYSRSHDAVHVEINGGKLFTEPGLGRGKLGDYGTRRYGPHDVLPEWAEDLVERYRPELTEDGGWR